MPKVVWKHVEPGMSAGNRPTDWRIARIEHRSDGISLVWWHRKDGEMNISNPHRYPSDSFWPWARFLHGKVL